jgi:hypothetical protein
MVFQTQVPISLVHVILVIGIQDLYMSKYKYTINLLMQTDYKLLYYGVILKLYAMYVLHRNSFLNAMFYGEILAK